MWKKRPPVFVAWRDEIDQLWISSFRFFLENKKRTCSGVRLCARDLLFVCCRDPPTSCVRFVSGFCVTGSFFFFAVAHLHSIMNKAWGPFFFLFSSSSSSSSSLFQLCWRGKIKRTFILTWATAATAINSSSNNLKKKEKKETNKKQIKRIFQTIWYGLGV